MRPGVYAIHLGRGYPAWRAVYVCMEICFENGTWRRTERDGGARWRELVDGDGRLVGVLRWFGGDGCVRACGREVIQPLRIQICRFPSAEDERRNLVYAYCIVFVYSDERVCLGEVLLVRLEGRGRGG
jgi:hypothetical protein